MFWKNLFGGNDPLPEIDKNTFLVDVREAFEFAEDAVKGSVNIPLSKVKTSIDKFKNKESIIVFCRSGNRSGQAKDILEAQGIKNVHNGGSWLNVRRKIEEKALV
jgi:phage shock protein E